LRIINDSVKLVEESKKVETRISRCDLLLQHLNELLKYERRGIEALNIPPSALISRYASMRDQIIVETLTKEYEDAKQKLSLGGTVNSRVNALTKLLYKVHEYGALAKDRAPSAAIERDINKEIQHIQLSGYLDEAKKAEFKRQKKKALDKYYEALYMLRHDDVDDSLQAESISFIEAKIRELGGEVK